MAQIAFKTMPRALATDAADMPHILGDPADVAWEGVAERVNADFAMFNAWTPALTGACHATAEASGAAVFVVDSPEITLNYAYARTLTLGGGIKLVSWQINLTQSTDVFFATGSGDANDVVLGAFTAAYRYNLGSVTLGVNGALHCTGYQEMAVGLRFAPSTGQLVVDKYSYATRGLFGSIGYFLHLTYPLAVSP